MIAHSARRRLACLVAALTAVITLSGCSMISPALLPSPGTFRSGWPLEIEFSSLVNLTEQSRVTVNGIEGGAVTTTAIEGDHAVVTVTMDDGVGISSAAIAEIRQDTLLGDTYVSIADPKSAGSKQLSRGGRIGIANTKKPVQVESLLTSLADFLGSGSLPQLGSTFNSVNAYFPEDPGSMRKIGTNLVETLDAWANNEAAMNALLDGANKITTAIAANRSMTDVLLSARGEQTIKIAMSLTPLFEVIGRVSEVTKVTPGLVPIVRAVNGIVGGVLKPILIPGWPDETTSMAEHLEKLLNDKLIPFFQQSPKLNIRRVAINNNVPTTAQADLMVRTFRMMGMIR